jgi:hypothetical protein
MKIIYTDIDGVLCLSSEEYPRRTEWGYVWPFNQKAVEVFNKILEQTGADIVISSDWKHHYTLGTLRDIFTVLARIQCDPVGTTPYIPGGTLQNLNEFRAKEILMHVEEHKPEKWVAIDDLDLSEWISKDHFVHLPKHREGIKQTGKAQKIINLLNND